MKKDVSDEDDDESPSIRKRGRRAQKRQDIVLSKKFSPRFLEDCDSRLHIVRLLRKRVEALIQDAGGTESEQRAILCKRASFLSIYLESMESEAAESGIFDIGTYTQSLNALNGCLKALGLERRAKKAGGLSVYLAEKEKASK